MATVSQVALHKLPFIMHCTESMGVGVPPKLQRLLLPLCAVLQKGEHRGGATTQHTHAHVAFPPTWSDSHVLVSTSKKSLWSSITAVRFALRKEGVG